MTSIALLFVIFLFNILQSCHSFVSSSNLVQIPRLNTPRPPLIAAFNSTKGRSVESDDNARTEDINKGLILTDLVGVLVACQIIGLLDVLNDPSFYDNGGWLQPIPSFPSSLPTLVQRIAFYSTLFVSSSPLLGFYKQNLNVIKSHAEIQTAIAFSFVGFLGATIIAASSLGGYSEFFQSAYGSFGAMRDCYVIVLVTWAARFLYRSLFR